MASKLLIGPLIGGGLVPGWRCPSQCRHCLYGAGPHRRDGEPPSDEQLETLLDTLQKKAPQASWHIGGGEPFLNRQRLRKTILGMHRRNMILDYVETNASWVDDLEQTESILLDLAGCGLRCLLISLSPFHAEFVPLAKTRLLIAAATKILPHGALVWVPEFTRDLMDEDRDHPLDFNAFLARQPAGYALELAERYFLVPAGRAGRFLADQGERHPPEELVRRAPCARRLTDTSHVHVDGEGWLVPGLCAGLVLPLAEVPGEIELKKYPVLRFLAGGDLAGLMTWARQQGFSPLEHYSSACDLCTHIRSWLFQHDGKNCPELGPKGFYQAKSLPAFF